MAPTLEEWNEWIKSIKDDEDRWWIKAMWMDLTTLFNDVPVPTGTARAEDDSCWQFVWDKEKHHIDIDIYPDFSYSWFYVNRKTNERDSGENEYLVSLAECKFPEYLNLVK